MIATRYHEEIISGIKHIRSTQLQVMERVADCMADVMISGGLVHLFGSGHSHLPVEEAFFRSGGLAPMNPIFDPSLMLHEGIRKVTQLERLEGYAEVVLRNYDLREGEIMIVFSVSGKNTVPVDMALLANKRGLLTVGVTSAAYARATPPMHPCGKHLHEVTDMFIDSGAGFGDAVVRDPRLPGISAVGALATITGLYIVNMLQMMVVDRYLERGLEPPLSVCMNTGEEAATAHNERTYRTIQTRMRHL